MAETIAKRITAVNDKGFQVEGYSDWFNLSTTYQGIPIPPVGTEIEFVYKPWLNPKSHKTAYYVDEIIPVTQVAAPDRPEFVRQADAPKSYDGLQQAVAPAPVASTPVPSLAPVAEPPRNGPEPVSADAGPVLGTQAYRDISIPKQVALKTAIDLLVGTYGGTASDEKAHIELTRLAMNAMVMAEQFYEHFLNNSEIGVADVAMPDDTLVPTPSQMDAPPPEYRG